MSLSNGHGAKYPRLKEKAIAALIEHGTMEAAAAAAGVSSKTLRRWRKDADFEAAYRQARLRTCAEAFANIETASLRAARTLEELLDDRMPPGIRYRAACSILDRARDAAENDEIIERVAKLEKQLEKLENQK